MNKLIAKDNFLLKYYMKCVFNEQYIKSVLWWFLSKRSSIFFHLMTKKKISYSTRLYIHHLEVSQIPLAAARPRVIDVTIQRIEWKEYRAVSKAIVEFTIFWYEIARFIVQNSRKAIYDLYELILNFLHFMDLIISHSLQEYWVIF